MPGTFFVPIFAIQILAKDSKMLRTYCGRKCKEKRGGTNKRYLILKINKKWKIKIKMLQFLKIKIKIRRWFFDLIFLDIVLKAKNVHHGVLKLKLLFYEQTYISLGRLWYAFFMTVFFSWFYWVLYLEMIQSPSIIKVSL